MEGVSTYSVIHHNRVLGGGGSDVTGVGVICESERKERRRRGRRSWRRKRRVRKRGGIGIKKKEDCMGMWGTCCA